MGNRQKQQLFHAVAFPFSYTFVLRNWVVEFGNYHEFFLTRIMPGSHDFAAIDPAGRFILL